MKILMGKSAKCNKCGYGFIMPPHIAEEFMKCPKCHPEVVKLWKKRKCGDCIHYDRCFMLMQRKKEDLECDWIPSKFKEVNKTETN